MSLSRQSNLALVILLAIAIGVMATVSRGKGAAEVNVTQDPASLDRRISMLEQRLYTIESSINRLQTYVATQRPPVSQPTTNDRDVLVLRDELQRLSLRLGEVECGLLKLDERTTAPARRNSKSVEPCRQNPDTSLRLPTRP
jgi:hypothetical protein